MLLGYNRPWIYLKRARGPILLDKIVVLLVALIAGWCPEYWWLLLTQTPVLSINAPEAAAVAAGGSPP